MKRRRLAVPCLLMLAVIVCGGCFDTDKLISGARDQRIPDMVDLGVDSWPDRGVDLPRDRGPDRRADMPTPDMKPDMKVVPDLPPDTMKTPDQ